ncbi:MAG: hypothetical protein AAF488_04820 [Planctomycetota bacterium]
MLPYATLLWLACWSTLLFFVGMLLGRAGDTWLVKLVLAPGLLIDSVLRLLACFASGTKIRRVNVLRTGPLLETGRPPIRHIGPAVFVTVRLLLLFVLLYLILENFPDELDSPLYFPTINPATTEQEALEPHSLKALLDQLRMLPEALQLQRAHGWLFAYVAVTTLLATRLTKGDWLASLYTVLVLHAIGWAGAWLGVTFGFLSRGQLIGIFYSEGFWSAFSLLVTLTVTALLLAAPLRVIPTLLGLSTKPEPVEKEKGDD